MHLHKFIRAVSGQKTSTTFLDKWNLSNLVYSSQFTIISGQPILRSKIRLVDLRLFLALLIGKLIAFVLKLTGGGGTTAPGYYALKIDPKLIKKIAPRIRHGSIIISGTNGKTTTARLISHILSCKFKIVNNRQGSNLLRGIASTLINEMSFTGSIRNNLAIWEVDEAILSEAVINIKPKLIVLLNLFRDQLDRYGEIDSIRANWKKIITNLSSKTILLLNTDDPGISFLEKFHKGKLIFFGVNDKKIDLPQVANIVDINNCPFCEKKLNYTSLIFAHIGHYSCNYCNWQRKNPDISANNISFKTDFSTSFNLSVNRQKLYVSYNLPGLYNVYNILASVAVSNHLKIDSGLIIKRLKSFSAAFGRFEKIRIANKNVIIFLIKNPTGANEIIRTIAAKTKLNLLIALNDNFADGKDVSWIWDTDWEQLSGKIKSVKVSGIRAWDMATRLKYANIKLSTKDVNSKINYSVKFALKSLSNNNTLIILPTYTALISIQSALHQMGVVTKWQKQ